MSRFELSHTYTHRFPLGYVQMRRAGRRGWVDQDRIQLTIIHWVQFPFLL